MIISTIWKVIKFMFQTTTQLSLMLACSLLWTWQAHCVQFMRIFATGTGVAFAPTPEVTFAPTPLSCPLNVIQPFRAWPGETRHLGGTWGHRLGGTWGHWLGGDLGTSVKSLASLLNMSFSLVGTWGHCLGRDLGTLVRGDLGTWVKSLASLLNMSGKLIDMDVTT